MQRIISIALSVAFLLLAFFVQSSQASSASVITSTVSVKIEITLIMQQSQDARLDRHKAHLRHMAHLKHMGIYVVQEKGTLKGTLSCSGLEALWESAGGSHYAAFTAAEVAMAESGGNQYATGPVGERGYWQINPDHGSLSTYDPMGNARAAIIISSDGTDWSAWTTYTSGLYIGRC